MANWLGQQGYVPQMNCVTGILVPHWCLSLLLWIDMPHYTPVTVIWSCLSWYNARLSSTHTCIYSTPCIVMLMCYTRCLLVEIRLFEIYLAQHIQMVALYKSTKFKLSRSVGYIELLQSKKLLLEQRMAYLVIRQGGIKLWNIWWNRVNLLQCHSIKWLIFSVFELTHVQ